MKVLVQLITVLAMTVFLASCASTPIDVSRVLELKPDQKVYTSYNLWYDNKDEILQINYHVGKILPFGTEVKIIDATREGVSFQDVATGEKYRVLFVRKIMITKTEYYIKNLFTVKNAEELASGIRPEFLEKIRTGKVEKGMSRKEVILAYGYPAPHRTTSLSDDTWIYFSDAVKKERVVFSRKGLVLEIMKDEQEKK